MDGNILERKIQPGRVRNVFQLTHDEVTGLMGTEKATEQEPELVLTVGGDPPPEKPRKSRVGEVTPKMVEELRLLLHMAYKRAGVRRRAGGLFFDSRKAEVNVWQSYKGPGLAWDQPFRKGWRRTEGDPVIQFRTKGLTNWFSPNEGPIDLMVRETMLLACEIGAVWSSERRIPGVFRGTVKRPDEMASEKYFEEVIAPSLKNSESTDYPMHLGLNYLKTFGNTALNSTSFRHDILGLDAYCKVTSPLRRYGDMVMHWQIEAALREEARTGKSLVTTDRNADRSFLPFSDNVLRTILVGLAPRERMVLRAKNYSDQFWVSQLLFRAHHFGEIQLPFGNTLHAYIHTRYTGAAHNMVHGCLIKELNMPAVIRNPEETDPNLPSLKMGDTWECTLEGVNVFQRLVQLKPVRVVDRMEE